MSDRDGELHDTRVLVAEGRGDASESAAGILRRAGAEVVSATDGGGALSALRASPAAPDVVLSEVRWPTGSGFNLLEATRRLHPSSPVILFTGQPTIPEAVRAMQEGAESYLTKPFGEDFVPAVRKAVERRAGLGREGVPLRAPRALPPKGLVGDSPAMQALFAQIGLIGPTRTTVLLLGETGTGKERLAQAIHDASPRRHEPFVAVNCAALVETVLESELFGHEKGSFSGAVGRREGRFKVADGGTIFLDEIGEISPAVQVKLLRVLQERKFERVGGNETVSVDVRIIAATNRNLREMVESRAFRADLYYRLNVVALDVPPLRARKMDIPPLVNHILPRLALDLGIPEPALTPQAMRILCDYPWPGNVRELENVLERALILSRGRPISEVLLSRELAPSEALERPDDRRAPLVPGSTFAEIERHAIMTTYEACGRSPQKTAQVLGLSPRTIHYRLREYSGLRGRRLPADCTPCAPPLQTVR
ncbi:MAG TPA: sigma-54 dependent transcriptional regulator [Polyangia bacterium]|nr:sigma-54 dependent transcriptional regulator [Polyangia bacterium]